MTSRGQQTILLLGGSGQVGWELARTLTPLGRVESPKRHQLDLADLGALRARVQAIAPSVIVNAAAYTHVDQAESEPDLAQLVNAQVPAVLASEAEVTGALLIHFSTDYVFDGSARKSYDENDRPAPLNAYGRSKLAGDEAVLSSRAQAYIFRIGWVYGGRGHNFLRTIRRLAEDRDELKVVSDQVGTPTWSRLVAEMTALALARVLPINANGKHPEPGMYHMAAPDSTTWFGFAEAILRSISATGGTVPSIEPITSAERPLAAARPSNSALNSSKLLTAFGLSMPPWREQLDLCLNSI